MDFTGTGKLVGRAQPSLGRSVSRKEFQEAESDILQQALSTVHEALICDHIMIPYGSWDFPNGRTIWLKKGMGLELAFPTSLNVSS